MENERPGWDTGVPSAHSHEQYRTPDTAEEAAAVTDAPSPADTDVDTEVSAPEPQENDHASDSDSAATQASDQDLSALTEGDDSSYS